MSGGMGANAGGLIALGMLLLFFMLAASSLQPPSSRGRALRKNGARRLHAPWQLHVTCLGGLALAAVLVVIALTFGVEADDRSAILGLAAAACLLSLLLELPSMARTSFDGRGISRASPFGRTRVRWRQIRRVRLGRLKQWLVLETDDSRVRVPLSLHGVEELVDAIERHSRARLSPAETEALERMYRGPGGQR